ncbi:MAG: hypothetical protein V5789_09210 [Colwellia sp.]
MHIDRDIAVDGDEVVVHAKGTKTFRKCVIDDIAPVRTESKFNTKIEHHTAICRVKSV